MASLLAKSANRSLTARPSRAQRRNVTVRAADRELWLPSVTPPAHLDGTLAGDRGFDPLGLGSNPTRLKWLAEGEKTNGRWAMAAVAGILGQEILTDTKWFEVGAKSDVPLQPLIAVEFLTIGFLELKRYQGFKETGSSGFLNAFPFDPAGMNSPDMAVKEVKNGRLAMLAFLGFSVQALVTRTQPIEGLTAHLADPLGFNFAANLNNLPKFIAS